MTAAGDVVLANAYNYVGMTESPPYSNLCSPFTDAWGPGAWCAMFTSYCNAVVGYPYPAINGSAGLSYCPDGQYYAYTTGHSVGEQGVEPGDSLIFSWEPWHMENGYAVCSYGVYAGAPAGDHIGLFVRWLGGGYMAALEGNTSASSWDNGGAVMERNDRHTSQICCYARHAALGAGKPTTPQIKIANLLELGMFLLENTRRGIWLMGPGYAYGLNPEEYSQVAAIPGIQTFYCGDNERAFDLLYGSCMNGGTAVEN